MHRGTCEGMKMTCLRCFVGERYSRAWEFNRLLSMTAQPRALHFHNSAKVFNGTFMERRSPSDTKRLTHSRAFWSPRCALSWNCG